MQHILFFVLGLNFFASRLVIVGDLSKARGQPVALQTFQWNLLSIDVLDEHVDATVVTLLAQTDNLVKIIDTGEQVREAYKRTTTDHCAADTLELAAARRDLEHADA